MATLTLAVLVSGSGTNLQAIIDAVEGGTLDAEIRLVLSNKPGVLALERASRAGIATCVLSHRHYASREAYDGAMVEALRGAGADWVVLAGFMRVLGTQFLSAFPGRIINIHPALLPSFAGINAQRQAVEYGVKVSGCTVHFVDEGVDSGPIIAQRAVTVLDDDDENSLRERILEQEHQTLVQVLQWIAADRLRIEPGAGGVRAKVRVRSE